VAVQRIVRNFSQTGRQDVPFFFLIFHSMQFRSLPALPATGKSCGKYERKKVQDGLVPASGVAAPDGTARTLFRRGAVPDNSVKVRRAGAMTCGRPRSRALTSRAPAGRVFAGMA